jgi:hypothetical protein
MREIEAQSSAQPTLDATATLPGRTSSRRSSAIGRLVLTVFVIGTLAVTAWAWTLPPTYKASAILMIRDNRTRLAVSPDAHTGSVMDTGSMDEVNSLVALLTSEVWCKRSWPRTIRSGDANDEPELGLVDWVSTCRMSSIGRCTTFHSLLRSSAGPAPIADGIVVQRCRSPTSSTSRITAAAQVLGVLRESRRRGGHLKYTRLSYTTRAQQFYRNQPRAARDGLSIDATVA